MDKVNAPDSQTILICNTIALVAQSQIQTLLTISQLASSLSSSSLSSLSAQYLSSFSAAPQYSPYIQSLFEKYRGPSNFISLPATSSSASLTASSFSSTASSFCANRPPTASPFVTRNNSGLAHHLSLLSVKLLRHTRHCAAVDSHQQYIKAVTCIQAVIRTRIQKQQDKCRQNSSILVVQSALRTHLQRKLLHQKINAAILIQSWLRQVTQPRPKEMVFLKIHREDTLHCVFIRLRVAVAPIILGRFIQKHSSILFPVIGPGPPCSPQMCYRLWVWHATCDYPNWFNRHVLNYKPQIVENATWEYWHRVRAAFSDPSVDQHRLAKLLIELFHSFAPYLEPPEYFMTCIDYCK
jgi:hypothetical protein